MNIIGNGHCVFGFCRADQTCLKLIGKARICRHSIGAALVALAEPVELGARLLAGLSCRGGNGMACEKPLRTRVRWQANAQAPRRYSYANAER